MVTPELSTRDDTKPLVKIYGTSAKTKPLVRYGSLLMANASIYYETDTSKVYRYDEENKIWYLQKTYIYDDETMNPKIKLWGLTTDTKPIDKFGSLKLENGSVFTELETSYRYRYDISTKQWYKQAPISSGGGGGGASGLHVDIINGNLIFTEDEE